MSKNPFVNVLLAALVTLVPLAGAPQRLLHPAPWLAFVTAIIVLVSQPPLDPKTMLTDARDRLTGMAIFVAQIGSVVAATFQFGYRGKLWPPAASPWVIAGAIVVAMALTLRLWAIRTLGRFFTSTVRVVEDQKVVDRGPYRLLRHPSYTGALMCPLGVAVALGSPIGAVIVLIAGVPAYLYRMNVEERALANGLGDPYIRYQRRTRRLIPFVY